MPTNTKPDTIKISGKHRDSIIDTLDSLLGYATAARMRLCSTVDAEILDDLELAAGDAEALVEMAEDLRRRFDAR